MKSTDDEHELEPDDGPAWKRYEEDVKVLLDSMDDSTATRDVKRVAALSKVERQIDVLVDRQVTQTPVTIAVECNQPTGWVHLGAVGSIVTEGINHAPGVLESQAQHPVGDIRDAEPATQELRSLDA